MSIAISERRRAERIPTSARVRISFSDPTPTTTDAQLIETSATGFRMAHDSKELIPGLEVWLDQVETGTVEAGTPETSKRARIVWTHLLDGQRVSGCVLL